MELTKKEAEKQKSLLWHEGNVLGGNATTATLVTHNAGGTINNTTVVNVNDNNQQDQQTYLGKRRRVEAPEDPFLSIMERFLRLEEMKVKMEMDRNAAFAAAVAPIAPVAPAMVPAAVVPVAPAVAPVAPVAPVTAAFTADTSSI